MKTKDLIGKMPNGSGVFIGWSPNPATTVDAGMKTDDLKALADSHTELLAMAKAFYRERQHFSEAVAKQMEGVIQRAEETE